MHNETEPVPPKSEIGLALITIIFVFILLIYNISGPLLQYNMIERINAKTITIITGIITMFLFYLNHPINSFNNILGIDKDIIISFLLPGMMFSIGYNVRREFLFKYIKYILVYGLIATILSFIIISQTFIIGRALSLINIDLTTLDIICFSLALNAVDFFNTNQMIEKYSCFNTKKAFSISLGESLLNNSMNIALLQIFNTQINQSSFSPKYFIVIIKLIALPLFSIIIGVIIGCLSSLIFKSLIGSFKLNRVQQIILLLLFGLFSYSMGSILCLSPIISLLICAFCMSHYTFFNLSFQSREESSLISKTIGHMSEGIIYAYIGINFLQTIHHSFSLSFVILSFTAIILSRFIIVILLTISFRFKITMNQFLIISFTNLNRGITSLCITLSFTSINTPLFLSTIMIIILISNSSISIILKLIINEDIDQTFMELNQLIVYFSNSNSYLNPRVASSFNENSIRDWMKYYLREFDNNYMKKALILNWPEVKDEYAELVREIHLTFTSNLKPHSHSSSIVSREMEKLDDYIDNMSLLKKSIVSFHSSNKVTPSYNRDEG